MLMQKPNGGIPIHFVKGDNTSDNPVVGHLQRHEFANDPHRHLSSPVPEVYTPPWTSLG